LPVPQLLADDRHTLTRPNDLTGERRSLTGGFPERTARRSY
jgi:hypothetical protein